MLCFFLFPRMQKVKGNSKRPQILKFQGAVDSLILKQSSNEFLKRNESLKIHFHIFTSEKKNQ